MLYVICLMLGKNTRQRHLNAQYNTYNIYKMYRTRHPQNLALRSCSICLSLSGSGPFDLIRLSSAGFPEDGSEGVVADVCFGVGVERGIGVFGFTSSNCSSVASWNSNLELKMRKMIKLFERSVAMLGIWYIFCIYCWQDHSASKFPVAYQLQPWLMKC